jgi:hypothetical protein
MAVKPVPAGSSPATPYVMVGDAAHTMALYTQAFDATDVSDALPGAGRHNGACRDQD